MLRAGAELPSAAVAALVAGAGEHVGQEHLIRERCGAVRQHPKLAHGAAGEQSGPAGRGHRRGCEAANEVGAALRQNVDVRSADLPVAVAAEHPGGQVIHQNQQDTRPGELASTRPGATAFASEQGQRGSAEEEFTTG